MSVGEVAAAAAAVVAAATGAGSGDDFMVKLRDGGAAYARLRITAARQGVHMVSVSVSDE